MSIHILLVEDEEDIRTMYAEQLTLAGYDVTTAVDGLDAINKVSTLTPDVVLLDIILPEIDGLEVLRRIKADGKTASIPVVMLSNLSQNNQREQSAQLGANAFYVKASMTPSEMSKHVAEELQRAHVV